MSPLHDKDENPGSLPLRECGLKLSILHPYSRGDFVTPLAGVWIEISAPIIRDVLPMVTPLAGVWIEILFLLSMQ